MNVRLFDMDTPSNTASLCCLKVSFAALAATFFSLVFTACGDDSSSASVEISDESSSALDIGEMILREGGGLLLYMKNPVLNWAYKE
jgi:hypothetical protein